MAEARIEDLEGLYKELDRSMQDVDAMISQVDAAFNTARQEWQSKGAEQFDAVHDVAQVTISLLLPPCSWWSLSR